MPLPRKEGKSSQPSQKPSKSPSYVEPEYEEDETSAPAKSATTGKHGGKRGGPRLWTQERVTAMRGVMKRIKGGEGDLTINAVVRGLKSHPLFEGEEDRLTPVSVSQQINKARKGGMPGLPELDRSRGPRIDYAALADIDDD